MATAVIRQSGERAIRRHTTMEVEPIEAAPARSDIAARAFMLFLERGAEHGRDMEDWLQAERELSETSSIYE